MNGIEIIGLAVAAGEFRLDGFDLAVPRGRYCVMMGRTGSGKSTLLETICGLRRQRSGTIVLDGEDVSRLPSRSRGIGYVPQDGALFPSMTVAEHLEFPLRIRGWTREARRARVHDVSEHLGLGPLMSRRPRGLSGGERQRTALGRALVFAPRVVLLDEPLSALDESSRDEMYDVLERVRGGFEGTFLHVTHSRDEANRLADQVVELAPP